MAKINDFDKQLMKYSNYKELMTALGIDDVNKIANLLVRRVYLIVKKDFYMIEIKDYFDEINQIFIFLNDIIKNECSKINADAITKRLELTLKETGEVKRTIKEAKTLDSLKQFVRNVEQSILLCIVNEPNDTKYNFMYFLISKRKDYLYLSYLNEYFPSFFVVNNNEGTSLFERVFKQYVSEIIKIKDGEGINDNVMYYEKVLMLFKNNRLFDLGKEKIRTVIEQTVDQIEGPYHQNIINSIAKTLLNAEILLSPNIIYPNGLVKMIKSTAKDDNEKYDFTNLYTFSIDTPKAKMLDDAFSIERLKNGNILFVVHISGVILNLLTIYTMEEVIQRIFKSQSLGGKVREMSSLYPNQLRNCLTHLFEIDSAGNLVNFQVVKSQIINRTAITFSDSFQIMNANEPNQEVIRKKLLLLKELCESMNYKYTCNTERFRKRNIGIYMVENSMAYTNVNVANFFEKNNYPFWFKVQQGLEIPNIYRSCNFDTDEILSLEMDNQNIRKEILLSNPIYYSNKNIGYYKRNQDTYGHVTSPIIDNESRIDQALELTFLVEKRINDEEISRWNEQLKRREQQKNSGIALTKKY